MEGIIISTTTIEIILIIYINIITSFGIKNEYDILKFLVG